MSTKVSIEVERQIQFVEWLQARKLYNPYASAAIMRNMQTVWEQFVPPQIRFANGRNPKGLELGEKVKFSKTATIEYRDVNSELKTLKFEEKSGQGVVVGVCFKCEGERIPSRQESEGWEYPSYTVGPEWVTHKRHLFYEIKICLDKPSVLVHPDHVESLT